MDPFRYMQMGNYNIYYSQRPDGDIQIAKAKKIASKDAEKLARDGTLENKVKEMEKANEKMLQELLAMKKRGISYSDPAYQEKAKNLVANKMLLDTYKDTLHRTNAEKLKKGASSADKSQGQSLADSLAKVMRTALALPKLLLTPFRRTPPSAFELIKRGALQGAQARGKDEKLSMGGRHRQDGDASSNEGFRRFGV